MDRRPGEVAQLEVARQEVGVEMREDDMLDPETEPAGIGEVAVDVALRVDHRGETALLVADEIGGMCKAAEVVLLEDHRPAFLPAGGPSRQSQRGLSLDLAVSWPSRPQHKTRNLSRRPPRAAGR